MDKEIFSQLVNNTVNRVSNLASFSRAKLANLLDPDRNIDRECGYPEEISPEQYRLIYNREGVAKRVVDIYPESSWADDPIITDTRKEEDVESPFCEAWKEFEKEKKLYHYLYRADEMSGIGRYGVMFLGINDGKTPNQPVKGVNPKTGEPTEKLNYDLQFIKCYSNETIEVLSYDQDQTSPRYNLPTAYQLKVVNEKYETKSGVIINVHWTRVFHLADNRKDSDVFGTPRMQAVFNRIYDLRKILSGAGEMFWKGGFPGYSVETNPDVGEVELDKESIKTEFKEYSEGLQRFLGIQGATVKSLSPQVADPSQHVEAMLRIISIALGVPSRIFSGAEESRLSSSQDARAWNRRVKTRRMKYINPMVLAPFIDLCINYGFLKALPKEGKYDIFWPDLNAATPEDMANIADKKTNALAKYVQGGVESVMAIEYFFVHILGMKANVAKEIASKAADMDDNEFLTEFMKETQVSGGSEPQQGGALDAEETDAS